MNRTGHFWGNLNATYAFKAPFLRGFGGSTMLELNTSDFHHPYNPQLVVRAKELRQNPTPAEKKLWQNYLQAFPLRVLRQRPIDHFIVDFYCAALKLVIEIDGESHFTDEGLMRDLKRTQILESYGLKVIRFSNDEVMNQFEGVCQKIWEQVPKNPS
jgi:very-short-patch-repair endonuclease